MEIEQVNNLVVPLPNENPLCPGPSPDVRIPPSFICTGDEIVALEEGWMKGHGTEIVNGKLYATVTGLVERVGKLITVKPLSARYAGDIGDVVIGRVLQVGQGRWSVDINHTLNGVLLLNSINLPNGVQRKRTVLDELNMRSFYSENDLISAEVQSVYHDGSISIHTRSQRYGKLQNGTLVVVPPYLVRRCKSHFITLDCGIFLVLGMNGYIWVSAFPPFIENSASSSTLAPTQSVPTVQTVKGELRQRVSKVCNVISCLAQGIITRPPFVILLIGKLFLL